MNEKRELVWRPPAAPGRLMRVAAQATALASVLAGKAFIALRLRRAPEGWRRTVGVLLRSQPTRFALSAFGLRVPPSDEPLERRTAQGLLAFLANEADAHFCLDWQPSVTIRRPTAFVDLVILRFGSSGRLEGMEVYLSSRGPEPPDAGLRARVHASIVTAYNRTADLPEVARPQALRAAVHREHTTPAVKRYVQRLLSAGCLTFENIDVADPAARFSPPSFAARRGLGFGYLLWIARLDPARNTVDLWVSAHHVGLDGVPLQDLLNRLETAWQTTPIVFPAPTPGAAFAGPQACHAPGERAVDQLVTFVDLSPVLELRRALNSKLGPEVNGDVTCGALFAWLLCQEPEFAGVRVASTVDVAASGGYERDVDVVPLRPADYATPGGSWSGFPAFAAEFNRLITASRARTSPLRAGMQTAGLLPPWAHATAIKARPEALDETFGSLCVTIIRDARVFIAPMTDLGLGHGFLAIGSATLPSADGAHVASVCIKGDAGRITHYPAILQRVLERSRRLHLELTSGGRAV